MRYFSQALTLIAVLIACAPALAQAPPPPALAEDAGADAEDNLPDIVARTFPVRTRRRSESMRVYLFEDVSSSETKTGKILLLKEEGRPRMAFRVLRTYYPEKQQFAARRVKTYDGVNLLDIGKTFVAVEKLRDLAPYNPTPRERRQDELDLEELEKAEEEPLPDVLAYDPELDAGSSPPPESAVETKDPIEEDPNRLDSLAVDEVESFDPDSQWLSLIFGFFRNNGPPENNTLPSILLTGAGLRYGLTLGKMVFLREKNAQDSLVAEGGFGLYKILGFQESNEVYTIMPLTGTLRYNVLFSPAFAVFGYAGLQVNQVVSSSSPDEESVAILSSQLPAIGAGFFFRIGPKWHIRADFGIDLLGAGLVLRF